MLQNFNLIVLSATLAVNIFYGRVRSDHWPQMAVVAGSLILPAIWGSKIYVGMSAAQFKNVVLWILVFAGAVMIASAARALL